MPTLKERIAEVKADLRHLRRRLRLEPREPKRSAVPYDPEFDTWKAKSRRARYLKIIRDDTPVPEMSPVAKRKFGGGA